MITIDNQLHLLVWDNNLADCITLLDELTCKGTILQEINKYDMDGLTPLYIASAKGYYKMCKVLIEYGADIHIKDKNYNISPFYIACYNDKKDICLLLSERGADLEWSDRSNTSLLNTICRKENNALIEMLISIFIRRGNDFNENEMRSILQLYPNKFFDVCTLAKKECFNHSFSCFSTLHSLCEKGMAEEIKAIVSKKVNMYLYDNSMNTPLHIACKYSRYDICKLLIENGADVLINTMNEEGYTPFHYACEYGNMAICELLLKHGADLEIQNGLHQTPIIIASLNNNKHICRLLQLHGANIFHKDIHNKTSIYYTLLLNN